MKTLRVAAASKATSLAGAIAWAVRQEEPVELVAIGAGAVNQATKAVAIARTYLVLEGVDLYVVPSFETVSTPEAEERTAIRLQVEPHAVAVAVGGGLSAEAASGH